MPPENSRPAPSSTASKAATAPKSAVIAGIVFSLLLIVSFMLTISTISAFATQQGDWLLTHSSGLSLALNLVPFAGIAFLWFLGVVRDRLGKQEDQFIATVFLGSGLLFLAMLFVVTGTVEATVMLYGSTVNQLVTSEIYNFGRIFAQEMLGNYTLRMAGVFMISTSTLLLRSRVTPRWIAFLGYGLALVMLLRIGQINRLGWIALAFPMWTLLVSIYFLFCKTSRQVEQS